MKYNITYIIIIIIISYNHRVPWIQYGLHQKTDGKMKRFRVKPCAVQKEYNPKFLYKLTIEKDEYLIPEVLLKSKFII